MEPIKVEFKKIEKNIINLKKDMSKITGKTKRMSVQRYNWIPSEIEDICGKTAKVIRAFYKMAKMAPKRNKRSVSMDSVINGVKVILAHIVMVFQGLLASLVCMSLNTIFR